MSIVMDKKWVQNLYTWTMQNRRYGRLMQSPKRLNAFRKPPCRFPKPPSNSPPILLPSPTWTRILLMLTHQALKLKLLRILHMPIHPARHRPVIQRTIYSRGLGGYGVLGVEMQEHGDEEKEQEGDTVEEEDVGGVGDVCRGEEDHLFFSGTHEEEAGGVEEL